MYEMDKNFYRNVARGLMREAKRERSKAASSSWLTGWWHELLAQQHEHRAKGYMRTYYMMLDVEILTRKK